VWSVSEYIPAVRFRYLPITYEKLTREKRIRFRAFQGVGGSGFFLVSSVTVYEIVPKQKLPLYGGIAFITVALATIAGPLFGGAIDATGGWRWISIFKFVTAYQFGGRGILITFLSAPVGICAFAVVLEIMVAQFPHHSPTSSWSSYLPKFSMSSLAIDSKLLALLRRINFVGVILVLTASLLLVTPLLQAAITFKSSSPVTIVLLVLSGVLWISFFGWECYLSRRKEKGHITQEPVFSWRFAHNRVFLGVLLYVFNFFLNLLFSISITFITSLDLLFSLVSQ
jgi:hypothetical protein